MPGFVHALALEEPIDASAKHLLEALFELERIEPAFPRKLGDGGWIAKIGEQSVASEQQAAALAGRDRRGRLPAFQEQGGQFHALGLHPQGMPGSGVGAPQGCEKGMGSRT